MIKLTRLNGSELIVNSDLIETVEETPDTVVTLTTGHKYIVSEPASLIVKRVVQYQMQRLLDKEAIVAEGEEAIQFQVLAKAS